MCINICIVFVENVCIIWILDYSIVKSVCMLGVEIYLFLCSIEIIGCVGRMLFIC